MRPKKKKKWQKICQINRTWTGWKTTVFYWSFSRSLPCKHTNINSNWVWSEFTTPATYYLLLVQPIHHPVFNCSLDHFTSCMIHYFSFFIRLLYLFILLFLISFFFNIKLPNFVWSPVLNNVRMYTTICLWNDTLRLLIDHLGCCQICLLFFI